MANITADASLLTFNNIPGDATRVPFRQPACALEETYLCLVFVGRTMASPVLAALPALPVAVRAMVCS